MKPEGGGSDSRLSKAMAVKSENGDQFILSFDSLDEAEAIRSVRSPAAGATTMFIGTTRDTFKGEDVFGDVLDHPAHLVYFSDKIVSNLEYEAYSSLAMKRMQEIVAKARRGDLTPPVDERNQSQGESYGATVTRIFIAHRLGVVPVAENSIVITVSSPHRRESFEVAEWLLEQIKREVPIWKRESYTTQDKSWKSNFPSSQHP